MPVFKYILAKSGDIFLETKPVIMYSRLVAISICSEFFNETIVWHNEDFPDLASPSIKTFTPEIFSGLFNFINYFFDISFFNSSYSSIFFFIKFMVNFVFIEIPFGVSMYA